MVALYGRAELVVFAGLGSAFDNPIVFFASPVTRILLAKCATMVW